MKFRKIQRKPFLYCQTQQHPALFLTMRTGKCFITIKDIEFQEAFPALICVPLSTIYGWTDDLKKLGYTENDFSVLIGTKENKSKEFPELAGKKFILTNKEFFISIPSLIKKLNFKAVVVDESTCLKNYKTRIYKFFTKNFRDTERRYILTGTSMIGSVLDIYGQMQFLDPTFFNCKTFWDFKNEFFIELYPHHFVLKPHLSELFYKRLSERCCFVTLSDVRKSIGKKDLEINRTVRTFELSEEMREIYIKLKEDFLVSYEDNVLFGFNHFLQSLVYLRKLCSGYLTINPETKETKFIDPAKYQLLMDILKDEIPDYKVIILCNFYDEINQIKYQFDKRKLKYGIITGKTAPIDRGKVMNDFQTDKIQYVIGNSTCLKFGVTLSEADLLIEFSSILGAETREQVEFRGTDIYKDNSMDILHLIADKSIETFFYKKAGKQISNKKLQEELLTFLKEEE